MNTEKSYNARLVEIIDYFFETSRTSDIFTMKNCDRVLKSPNFYIAFTF